jgi:hypothetical protein
MQMITVFAAAIAVSSLRSGSRAVRVLERRT